MKPRILIIGSTGKLGSKLLKFAFNNDIKIDAICCFNNQKKLIFQSQKFKIKNKIVLFIFIDEKRLFEY